MFTLEKQIRYSKYDCVIGCSYYYSGSRIDTHGVKKALPNIGKCFQPLIQTLERLKQDERESGMHWLYVIINDQSPYDSPLIQEVVRSLPSYVFINMKANVGIGHKDNILQTIGTKYSDKVLLFDCDVHITTSIQPLFQAFKDLPKLGCATINAGWMGGLLTYQFPSSKYIPTAQIGNARMWDTKIMKEKTGYSSIYLKYFNDLDQVYKLLWLGYESVMVTSVIGKTKPSGGAAGTMNMERQIADATYMCKQNPLVSFSKNKYGKPIIRFHKDYGLGLFADTFVKELPSGVALSIVKKLK